MAWKRFTNAELNSAQNAPMRKRANPRERRKLDKYERDFFGAPKGSTIDGNGNVWCSRCDCLVKAGRCTNFNCSSNN
jgi:hypothetical protein